MFHITVKESISSWQKRFHVTLILTSKVVQHHYSNGHRHNCHGTCQCRIHFFNELVATNNARKISFRQTSIAMVIQDFELTPDIFGITTPIRQKLKYITWLEEPFTQHDLRYLFHLNKP